MRYLGVDYGRKRTGVAISDAEGRVAVVKETIDADGQQEVINRLRDMVTNDAVNVLVVGVPYNMAGEPTDMTDEVTRFVEKLRGHVTIPVQTIDERLTTEMAKTLLRGMGEERRDQVAAQILLQNFLDELQTSTQS